MTKRQIKRMLTILLALTFICTILAPGALAMEPERLERGEQDAWELYALGLFQGAGTLPDGTPDFNLESTPTRAEAITMLVRLLGGEEEALSAAYAHPFTDAGWADAYIGYAYHYGITAGISDTEFGASMPIGLEQFLTLVLRALGYEHVDWQNPYPTADAANLYYSPGEGFYRADVASICLSALDCAIVGEEMTMREMLEEKGVLSSSEEPEPEPEPVEPEEPEPLVINGFAVGPVTEEMTRIEIDVNDSDAARPTLSAAHEGRARRIWIQMPGGQMDDGMRFVGDFCRDAGGNSGYIINIVSYDYGYSGPGYNLFILRPSYQGSEEVIAYLEGKRSSLGDQEQELLEAALRIHADLVDPSMSEYEQVKIFHDYLIDKASYSTNMEIQQAEYELNRPERAISASQPRIFDAVGALVDGSCVCEGYAEAFDLLCYLSGIDCKLVVGTVNGGGHMWNKVQIDGYWYNVDITFDDPIGNGPVLKNDYFLLSDYELSMDHQWTDYGLLPAAELSYAERKRTAASTAGKVKLAAPPQTNHGNGSVSAGGCRILFESQYGMAEVFLRGTDM